MINWNRCSRSAEFSVHDPPEHETSSHATIDVPARLNVCHITILGQASRRTSTSCGFHANRTTGMFSILSERYGCGNQKFRARFLGPCPADAVGVVEQGVLIFTKLVSPDQIAALNLLIGLAIDRLYPDPNCRSRD